MPLPENIPEVPARVLRPDPDNTGGGSMKFNPIHSILKFSMLFALAAMPSMSFANGQKDISSLNDEQRKKVVVVYTYDSFAGEWGPGPELTKRFEKATGYKLELVDCGDAIQAINKAILEKDNVQADVLLGIDNNTSSNVKISGILEKYIPKNSQSIVSTELRKEFGSDGIITPYDYGHFAIIYDTKSSVPEPKSLQDLTKSVYAKKIILMNPRTSTPGLGFLAWTVSVLGDSYKDYWKALKPNVLTMTSGWSEGWGMFLKGEAPLVISYTTSPAYCVEYESNDRYKALVFNHGHVEQVEGYALLKNAPNPDGGKAFMDFMLTKEAQECLPLTQWMYPVNKDVTLPESYKKAAPVPAKTLITNSARTKQAIEPVMQILGK